MNSSSDDSSDESPATGHFGSIISGITNTGHSPVSGSTALNDDELCHFAGMDGLEIACRRVRFAQEALQHGQGKRLSRGSSSDDEPGSRSPPLRTSHPRDPGKSLNSKQI